MWNLSKSLKRLQFLFEVTKRKFRHHRQQQVCLNSKVIRKMKTSSLRRRKSSKLSIWAIRSVKKWWIWTRISRTYSPVETTTSSYRSDLAWNKSNKIQHLKQLWEDLHAAPLPEICLILQQEFLTHLGPLPEKPSLDRKNYSIRSYCGRKRSKNWGANNKNMNVWFN